MDAQERIIRERVGRRVREARLEAGETKSGFCLMAGISRPYLDRVEAGEANLSLRMLVRLASCLRVDPADLLR